ncbi:MAG: TrmJ/YjtD family RNA methyltransferase [Gemmatimonadota bacterium]
MPADARLLAEQFVVVLHEPQDVVNMATTARAMMNFGLRRLRLVNPVDWDEQRVLGIAHAAGPVVERLEMVDTLDEALEDTVHVVGTSARQRTQPFVWQHPREAVPELFALAAAGEGPVALLFGREDRGLENPELDRCDRVLTVPTDGAFSSLNLAQAVLLIAHELWMAGPGGEAELPTWRRAAPPATHEQLGDLFRDTKTTLEEIEFFKKKRPEAIMRTLRAVARRADLDQREAKLLRATALEVRNYVRRKLARPG